MSSLLQPSVLHTRTDAAHVTKPTVSENVWFPSLKREDGTHSLFVTFWMFLSLTVKRNTGGTLSFKNVKLNQ